MKNIVRGHMIIMSIVILAFLIVSGRKVDVRVRTPQHFDIQFDQSCTDSAQAIMSNFINTLDKRIALYPSVLVAVIKEQFPFIKAINTRLVPPSTMKLICKMYNPLCLLNQELLLISTACLCPINYYCKEIVATLPQLAIDPQVLAHYDSQILVDLVKKLDKKIFVSYKVTVSTDDTLILQDNIQPKLSLICRIDNIPSETLSMHGKDMRELLENRNAFKAKSNNQFIADLRFQKQIILTKK